jgi:iron complex transport system permease protein
MSLGMTSGSSLAVVILFVLGWHLRYPVLIPIGAFVGSLLTLLAVYYTARRRGHLQMTLVILTGIAFSTVMIALQGAMIYAFRDEWALVQTITEWEAGSTMDRSWHHAHLQAPLAIIGLMGCWFYRHEMNLLSLGDDEALNLGVEISRVRWRLFLCVSLLVGGAIAAVGIIAFFGLVLPHILRKWVGADHRLLIPLSMVAGSAALAMLDLSLRILKIHAFTIGSVSAIIGGIFFLVLLCETRARETRLGF